MRPRYITSNNDIGALVFLGGKRLKRSPVHTCYMARIVWDVEYEKKKKKKKDWQSYRRKPNWKITRSHVIYFGRTSDDEGR